MMAGAPKKLDVADLKSIELLLKEGKSLGKIAQMFSVSKALIFNVAKSFNGNNGPSTKPKVLTISRNLRKHREIPVEVNVKGDTVRAIFMMLTGSSHRGKINECLLEVQTILGHLDFKARIRKEVIKE